VTLASTRQARRYRCACGDEFQVFGLGRHRRFYELSDMGWARPVMGRLCPHCHRDLPTVAATS
jgi:hypothetical protein